MLKRVACFLLLVTPAMAATLTGVVKSDENRWVSGAKVVLFHELAMVVVLRATTDRNGKYSLELEPGPYRVFVLKEGFRPAKARAMLLHQDEVMVLEHGLVTELALTQKKPADNLKSILRRSNRDPFRSLESEPLSDLLPAPAVDESLAGSVRAGARQSLSGETAHISRVKVNTQLTDQVQLESNLSNEKWTQGGDVNQMQAGVSVNLPGVSLDVGAEAIRPGSGGSENTSDQVVVSGRYGRDGRSATSLELTRSQFPTEAERRTALTQDISYHLLDHPVEHSLAVSNFDRGSQSSAQLAKVHTAWRSQQRGGMGFESDIDYFHASRNEGTATKLWLTAEHNGGMQRYRISGKVGLRQGEQDEAIVQHHRFTLNLGAVQVTSEFREDINYSPFDSDAIYGDFLERPLTPYATESFYQQATREASLQLGFGHQRGWRSQFQWRRIEDDAELLQSYTSNRLRPNAERDTQQFAYSLQSDRYGSQVEISHSRNRGDQLDFDTTGVKLIQSLYPFRSRGMEFFFQLQLSNQPELPAWWLLETVPWDFQDDNTWYEGHLTVQF